MFKLIARCTLLRVWWVKGRKEYYGEFSMKLGMSQKVQNKVSLP